VLINNKLESINYIKKLNLNKFPEQLFKENEEEKVLEFLNKYPAKYYAIRDKSKARGIFKLKVLKEHVVDEIKDYSLYTINVSSYNFNKNQLLVGEIMIKSNNEVYLTISTNPNYSVRDALENPTYNLKTNLMDKKLNDIYYFDEIYNYIMKYNLIDIIVEFSLFDINVGINNEKIIIY